MIELMIGKVSLRFDFTFFAVMSLYFFVGCSELLMAAAACLIHELAHLAVMTALNVPANGVMLYGAGIRIYASLDASPCIVRIACLIAGVAVNILMSVLSYVSGEYLFSAVNLVTGIFNLLPVGEFDGAQLLRMLLLKAVPPEKIDRIMKAAGVISVLVCFFGILLLSGTISPMVFVSLLYLFIIVTVS